MRVVRILAALITVLGLVGGCGSGASTSAAPADPKEQLLAGIRALNSSTFRLVEKSTTGTVSTSVEGGYDPARRAARFTRSDSLAGKNTGFDSIAVGTDVYVRYDVSVHPDVPAGRWLHIDGKRLKSLRKLGIDGDDMTGKLALAQAVTSVERTGPRELRGVYDPSAVSGAAGGPNASWRARFDEQNRLVWMSVTVPAENSVPAVTVDSTYSGFGEALSIERPAAGSTVDAPASLYLVFDR